MLLKNIRKINNDLYILQGRLKISESSEDTSELAIARFMNITLQLLSNYIETLENPTRPTDKDCEIIPELLQRTQYTQRKIAEIKSPQANTQEISYAIIQSFTKLEAVLQEEAKNAAALAPPQQLLPPRSARSSIIDGRID